MVLLELESTLIHVDQVLRKLLAILRGQVKAGSDSDVWESSLASKQCVKLEKLSDKLKKMQMKFQKKLSDFLKFFNWHDNCLN